MIYVITGGCGFIGSHLAERLVAAGHTLDLIDDLSTGSFDNIMSIADSPLVTVHHADIATYEKLPTLIKNADGVFHLAASVGVQNILEHPLRTIENNLLTTERVLKLASQYQTKVLITSSSEVYGESSKRNFKESDTLSVGPTSVRRWSYASTKIVEEHLALAYWYDHKLPVVVVRLFNTVGERQSAQYGMVIPRLMTQALQHQPLTIYGTGEQSRCFTYVKDVVWALDKLMNTPAAVGQVINIGSTQNVTITELADKIIRLTQSRSSKKYIPYKQLRTQGYDDVKYRKPDITKVKKLIGFKPVHTLNDILKNVLATAQKVSS